MAKILVIEDEAAIRRVLVKILSEENDKYEVDEAEDGLIGIDKFVCNHYFFLQRSAFENCQDLLICRSLVCQKLDSPFHKLQKLLLRIRCFHDQLVHHQVKSGKPGLCQ